MQQVELSLSILTSDKVILLWWKHDHSFILRWIKSTSASRRLTWPLKPQLMNQFDWSCWLMRSASRLLERHLGRAHLAVEGRRRRRRRGAADNSAPQHIKQRPVKKQSTPYLTGVNLMAIGCSGLLTLSKRLHVSHSPLLSNWKAARLLPDEVSTVYLKRRWLSAYFLLLITGRWWESSQSGRWHSCRTLRGFLCVTPEYWAASSSTRNTFWWARVQTPGT